MAWIRPNVITITRGDTFEAELTIRTKDWRRFRPGENDRIRFTIKSEICDPEPLMVKEIPVATMALRLEAAETKQIPARSKPYIYDIELRTPDDRLVATVIRGGEMYVFEEVC